MVQFLEASGELYPMWHYSDAAKLMAVTDHTQVLRQATLALTLALTLTCTLPLAQVLRVLDAKGLYLPHISAISPPYLPHISLARCCACSTPRAYISRISPLISPISPWPGAARARRQGQARLPRAAAPRG